MLLFVKNKNLINLTKSGRKLSISNIFGFHNYWNFLRIFCRSSDWLRASTNQYLIFNSIRIPFLEHWPGTPDLGIWKFWKLIFYLHLNILNLLRLIFRFLVVEKWRFLCDKNVHRRGNFLCLRYVHGGIFGIFWITVVKKTVKVPSSYGDTLFKMVTHCFWWRGTLVNRLDDLNSSWCSNLQKWPMFGTKRLNMPGHFIMIDRLWWVIDDRNFF